jgi:hypothetical protein
VLWNIAFNNSDWKWGIFCTSRLFHSIVCLKKLKSQLTADFITNFSKTLAIVIFFFFLIITNSTKCFVHYFSTIQIICPQTNSIMWKGVILYIQRLKNLSNFYHIWRGIHPVTRLEILQEIPFNVAKVCALRLKGRKLKTF